MNEFYFYRTGWTGHVALDLDLFGSVDAGSVLKTERDRLATRVVREQVGVEQQRM